MGNSVEIKNYSYILDEQEKYANLFLSKVKTKITNKSNVLFFDNVSPYVFDVIAQKFGDCNYYIIIEDFTKDYLEDWKENYRISMWGLNYEDKKEYMNNARSYLDKIKNIHFDLVLSNPPFSLGNEVTKAIIDTLDFDEFINLMPASDYTKNNLYQYIDLKNSEFGIDLEQIGFDAVGRISCCKLNKNENKNITRTDFIYTMADPNFVEFFQINNEKGMIPTFDTRNKNQWKNINKDCIIIHGSRLAIHCKSKESGNNEFWHIKEKAKPIPTVLFNYYHDYSWESKFLGLQYIYYIFPSKKACDNAKEFWKLGANGGLIFYLVKEIANWSTCGPIIDAIPRINWETISDSPLWKEGKIDDAVCEVMGLKIIRDTEGNIVGVKKK